MQKFLNTVTHFSIDSWHLLTASVIGVGIGFVPVTGEVNTTPTESEARQPLNGQIRITRVRAIAGFNDALGALTITVRDDGADTLAVVTIPAATTTLQDSGAISVTIAAGSLVAIKLDRAAGAGSIDAVGVEVQYERVLN